MLSTQRLVFYSYHSLAYLVTQVSANVNYLKKIQPALLVSPYIQRGSPLMVSYFLFICNILVQHGHVPGVFLPTPGFLAQFLFVLLPSTVLRRHKMFANIIQSPAKCGAGTCRKLRKKPPVLQEQFGLLFPHYKSQLSFLQAYPRLCIFLFECKTFLTISPDWLGGRADTAF